MSSVANMSCKHQKRLKENLEQTRSLLTTQLSLMNPVVLLVLLNQFTSIRWRQDQAEANVKLVRIVPNKLQTHFMVDFIQHHLIQSNIKMLTNDDYSLL